MDLSSLRGNSGRRIGRELLCCTGRKFSDHFAVIIVVELEENFCVSQVEKLVINMW
jgi:hypothetical protein